MTDPATDLTTTLAQLTPHGSRTAQFVGVEHGSQSSFYVSRNEPGGGPDLHTHPYTETFVVLAGAVRFTVGERVVDAGPDDVLVVPPETPHGFTNVGDEAMLSVNIHAAAQMQQTDLDCERLEDGSYRLT